MAIDLDRWVPLAEVTRPHGVRGELRLRLHNPDSDLLLSADEVHVRLKDGDEHEVSVDRARRADDAILLKLHSIDDRDRADELRGAVISLRRREFPPLEADEFYHCDLEGARAILRDEGVEDREWGTVEGFRSYPTVEVMVVRRPGVKEPAEVPMRDAFIDSLDADQGVVYVKNVDAFDVAEPPRESAPARPKPSKSPKWKKDKAPTSEPSSVDDPHRAASVAEGAPQESDGKERS